MFFDKINISYLYLIINEEIRSNEERTISRHKINNNNNNNEASNFSSTCASMDARIRLCVNANRSLFDSRVQFLCEQTREKRFIKSPFIFKQFYKFIE